MRPYAVIVGGFVIVPDDLAANYHRVGSARHTNDQRSLVELPTLRFSAGMEPQHQRGKPSNCCAPSPEKRISSDRGTVARLSRP